MNIIDVNKTLSNETRVKILKWLKNVKGNFPQNKELGHYEYGACVQYIQEKANLSQPTISHYLSMMEKAGLIISTRWGKWTYYKRNEENINKYLEILSKEL